MTSQERKEISNWISDANSIVITNHINPDGDAMGAALGLKLALEEMGFPATVIIPNIDSPNLRWMEGRESVLIADTQSVEVELAISKADLIFCLDYNTLSRTGEFVQSCLQKANAKTVLIDHHQQPDTHYSLSILDTSKSSTCEMVYDFIDELYGNKAMSMAFAECIYTGILTDSGSFRFSTTSAHTHQVASHLLQLGAVPNIIHERIFDGNSMSRMQLLGYMLNNMVVLPGEEAIVLSLPQSVLQDYGYQKGDTEGFVNYGLSINNIRISAFFREEVDGVKISFRSKGDLDVNTFSRTYFNGGGHRNAAGGKFDGKLKDAVNRFVQSWQEYSKTL